MAVAPNFREEAAVAETFGVGRVSRVRTWAAGAALLAGLCLLLWEVNGHYPIREWIFWRYLAYWCGGGVFALACFSSGDLAIRKILGRTLEPGEQLVVAYSIGMFVFSVGTFLAGLLGLFGSGFFFLFPLALVALGGRGALRSALSFTRTLAFRGPSGGPWAPATLVFGVLALALVYFPIMSPANVAYDARWYHLSIAEHYAAAGRITRLEEGWMVGAYPQLATMFFTWAQQAPGRYFDKVLLAAHVEWAMFLATLLGVPVLVRRLAPNLSGWRSWLFVFLFPGLFLYDSNLNVGADHFLAALTPASWILLLAVWPSLDRRLGVLFGLVLGALVLVKYTAIIAVVPLIVAFAARVFWLAGRRLRRKTSMTFRSIALGALVPASVTLLATTPHWLKNWIFYGDPMYPVLHRYFDSHLWSPEFELHFQNYPWAFRPSSDLKGLLETLEVGVKFAFVPHNWASMHGGVPVFGMLFSLSLLALPFVRAPLRVWALAAACELGVLVWYWTNHQDRYLQAILPWFASVTAVVMGLAWRLGTPAREAAVLLCAAQAIWGSDVPFIPTHTMIGDTPIRESARLLGQGYRRNYDKRLVVSDYEQARPAEPKKTKILVHNIHVHWGLQAQVVNDWAPFQAGISYIRLASPRGTYDKLKSMGVTHILTPTSPDLNLEQDSIGANLVFWEFAKFYTIEERSYGGFRVARMPPNPPPPSAAERMVVYAGCRGKRYASGLYHLRDLNQLYDQPFARPLEAVPSSDGEALEKLAERADFYVVDKCHTKGFAPDGFELIYQRRDASLYARPPR